MVNIQRFADDNRVVLISGALGSFAAAVVYLYWWYRDFSLRLVGDAKSVTWCQENVIQNFISHFTSSNLLYAGFEIPYCFSVVFTSVRTWLFLQVVLWAITVVLIYRTGATLFDERTGVISGLLLAGLWETFRFAIRPQSDLVFLFLLAVTLWALAKWRATNRPRWQGLAILSMVLFSLTRPFGFPLLVGWIGWLIFRPGTTDGIDLRSKRAQLLIGSVVLLGGVVALFFLRTQLNPTHTDPDTYWRKSFVAKWASGIVVTHPGTPTFRYQYTPRPAPGVIPWMLVNIDHLVSMGLLKIAFLFVPVLPRWSTFHIVVNLLTLLPVLIGSFASSWLILRNEKYDLAALLLSPVIAHTLTIALTFLDGGFNYRAPLTLVFVLLTAHVVVTVLEREWGEPLPNTER